MTPPPLTPLFRSRLSADEWTNRYPHLHDALEARRHVDNPVSFDAFAHSMMNGDLREVNRYVDDEGVEHDLTDTYGGEGLVDGGGSDEADRTTASEDEAETVFGSEHDEDGEMVDRDGPDVVDERSENSEPEYEHQGKFPNLISSSFQLH